MLRALIFDVDGTLADTEMAHLAAFNHAFAEMGLDWCWDVSLYTRLLAVSGGKERMAAYWQSRGDMPREVGASSLQQTIERLHEIKTATYEQAVKDGWVQMRPGVLSLLMEAAQAGMTLAIATTTSPANIAALLRKAIGPDWRMYFQVIEDASTAPRKKPDPMVYQQVLSRLALSPQACLAVEDSANGLQAACAAGLPTLITPNAFTQGQDFGSALRVVPDLSAVHLAQLREWHDSHVHGS
jgi:HAD superfamily hydrolase (TIGR01509 family)